MKYLPKIERTKLAAAICVGIWLGPLIATGGSKSKVAVMPIKSKVEKLSASTVDKATNYLRGGIAESEGFVVIAKERQDKKLKELIDKQKKESYKACYKESCQIPLGQQLAADSILRSNITHFDTCVLSVELVDLAKEATVAAERVSFECDISGLRGAIDEAVDKIATYRRGSQEKKPDQVYSVKFESNPVGANVLKGGEPICLTTPCLARVKEGDYDITVKKDGYKAQTKKVSIRDKTDSVSFDLSTVQKETAQPSVGAPKFTFLAGGYYGFSTTSSVTAVNDGRQDDFDRAISSQKGILGEVDYLFVSPFSAGLRASYETYGLGQTTNTASLTGVELHPKYNIRFQSDAGRLYLGLPVGASFASSVDGQNFDLDSTVSWRAGGAIGSSYRISDSVGVYAELGWQYRSLPYEGTVNAQSGGGDLEYDLSHNRFVFSAGVSF